MTHDQSTITGYKDPSNDILTTYNKTAAPRSRAHDSLILVLVQTKKQRNKQTNRQRLLLLRAKETTQDFLTTFVKLTITTTNPTNQTMRRLDRDLHKRLLFFQ